MTNRAGNQDNTREDLYKLIYLLYIRQTLCTEDKRIKKKHYAMISTLTAHSSPSRMIQRDQNI